MTNDPAPKGLTRQQEMFCQEYLLDLNGAQAALRAGYKTKSPHVQAAKLLAIHSISARVSELMAERSKRTEITQDRVLQELAAVGFTRFTDLATWDVDSLQFVPSDELAEAAQRSVKSVKVKRTTITTKDAATTTVELELTQHDKLSALDKLAKHLNLYGEHGDDGKRTGFDDLVASMAALRAKRAAE